MKIVCSGEEFRRRFLTVCSSPREVSPSAPTVTEMEAESESSVVSQPPPGTEPENREGSTDEVRSPKGWGGGQFFALCQTNALPHSLAACAVGRTCQGYFRPAQRRVDPWFSTVRTLQQIFRLKLFTVRNKLIPSSLTRLKCWISSLLCL